MHCSVLAEQAVKKALQQFYLENDMMTPERQIKFGILSEEHDH
jgi:hypothetical protein